MGAKGESAKKRILEAAHSLFSRKGYCGVTMKDVTEAAGFSRGGLYRHFASTEELFLELIRLEQADAIRALENALAAKLPPDQILRGFLTSRMHQVCRPEQSFSNAVSEFAANSERGKLALQERAAGSVQILTRLIISGNEAGCFACSQPESTASLMLWLMEGMSRHAALIPVSDEQICQQIDLLEKLLRQ